MKRILIALAVIASVSFGANAQVKSVADAKKAVDVAKAAADNEKKALKSTTWINLANKYLDAYNSALGNGWVGAGQQELKLVMGNDKPESTETAVIAGQSYTKEVYATRNYYYNADGILAIIEPTSAVVEDALGKAAAAFKKAGELDNGSKKKDICEGIATLNDKYMVEAMNNYQFGKFVEASKCFEKAAEVSEIAPYSVVDSTAYYNAGFTAWYAGDLDNALKNFKKCESIGYYYENGEVYAKLADIYAKKGDVETQVATLEKGFSAYPQSQGILIGLINYYLDSGKDTERLFDLLGEAKKNEPENASLYYVEGNIRKQLGQKEEAVAAYRQASVVNPAYDFGYIGEGLLFYEEAVAVSEKASQEMDDAKYLKLVEEFENDLKSAIDPFEKAFEVSNDEGVKENIAEYLKNIYYRFYDEGEQYKAGYEKYDAIVKAARQ